MLSRGPVKCPSTPNQPPPIPAAGGGSPDLRIAVFHLGETASGDLRSREQEGSPSIFFFRRFGPTPPDRSPYGSYRGPTCIMGATFAPLPAEGPETYARERNPGRGSAGRTPQVAPPAGPSHLTPSSPGEAKSRSREAPGAPPYFRLA